MQDLRERVVGEASRIVVAQEQVIEQILVALLVGGHVLLEGVPGVAKTLLVKVCARVAGCEFRRVQFTPDMMPSDLTGTMIFNSATADFSFRPGPVFTNFLLADEVNRTPPKTQSALLEVMEERQVTVEGQTFKAPLPFFVAATQNPIEYEGTYPLPEAQLDRFLFKIEMGYPTEPWEYEMLRRHNAGLDPRNLDEVEIQAVTSPDELLEAGRQSRSIEVHDEVIAYVMRIVRQTRSAPAIQLGGSPRAAVALLSASKARAWLYGRNFVTPDDVFYLTKPVLRHRLLLRPEAELEQYAADDVLDATLAQVPVPR